MLLDIAVRFSTVFARIKQANIGSRLTIHRGVSHASSPWSDGDGLLRSAEAI
jgi:hypothetical protein